MIKFPQDFFFGSATSATQSEGAGDIFGKSPSIWDYWYEIEPFKFHNRIGPKYTSNFYFDFKENVDLMEKTGHNSFRTSISWSRLIPKIDGRVNEEAVKFYKDYFKAIKDKGITLFVNFFHFDMPMYLQEIGGWANREVVDRYVDYCLNCFKYFDEYIDYYFTFNEPIVHVECGYLSQYHYPMEVDPKKAVQVAFNTQLASSLAIKALKKAGLKKKIGIILNLTPAYPRSNNENDIRAAEYANLFAQKSFLDPSVLGSYPEKLVDIIKKENLMPEFNQKDLDDIRENTVDFLGVNYYQPLRVKENPYIYKDDAIFTPNKFYLNYDMPGKKINPYRGWEIYPKALYDIAINLRDNYNNIEWLVSENGMGVEAEDRFKKDGRIEDDYRIDFMKEHLFYLNKAMKEGANCKGYQVWTFIDNWSWLNAYKNRYGLVEYDLETGNRKIKKSGYWFKELSDNKGFVE
ncbi:glycoside hydrolase family 1 protein [Anaerococcus sp. AGMB09787]|uniref:glycoside hydrolase family 1 protein n=1 Tax=Anaerococcus sp. AGMB09787 TaxID=2922869 RepID=UPI001FAEDE7F|nr:glycoside hydrolase family 1 protein [Anaerococcus sp. AGMB09787]